jgi:putative transposase
MASLDAPRPRRRAIRLAGYDYAQAGAYFITMCTEDRALLFGAIQDGVMRLNETGAFVEAAWQDLSRHYRNVALDEFVVMPNHVHGIIVIAEQDDHDAASGGAGLKPAPTKSHPVSEIVRGFKTFSARRINEHRGTRGAAVWQRNYYEHVIRNEASLSRIRQYVANNPASWPDDPENPAVRDRL